MMETKKDKGRAVTIWLNKKEIMAAARIGKVTGMSRSRILRILIESGMRDLKKAEKKGFVGLSIKLKELRDSL